MSEPLIVVIPHRLGKDEALRRIKDGVAARKPNSLGCCRSRRRNGQAIV